MEKKSLKWLYKNGKSSIPAMALLSVFSASLSLLSLRFVEASRSLINIAIGSAEGSFRNAVLLLLCLLGLQLVLQIGINFLQMHASARLEISLKQKIFRRLIRKEYLAVSKFHSGELLNRLNSDISVIVNGIVTVIPAAVLFLTSIVGGFIMLYSIDRVLAGLILAIGPFVLIGARLYSRRYKALHKKCQEADGKTKSFMLEILQNLLVVKSFGNETPVMEKSSGLQNESYRLRIKRTKVSVVAHVGLFLIFNAGYYFAVAFGAYRLSTGTGINFGDFTAILQLVNQIQSPFKQIASLIPQVFSTIASAERMLELEELAEEKEEKSVNAREVYRGLEEIVFDHVSFSYNQDSTVSGIDMHIKKGEHVVVAGESGAGKSTAVKLLLSIFQPQEGKIYLKTKNGNIPVSCQTRSLFAYVPQGNLILSGTIRENITFACGAASEEEIIKSAKIAQIWDFIESLEDGLDTKIGEKGLGLSEGQAQRIAIARAILYDAPVLLLDEATSALDSDTEIALLRAIRSMTDKTCILVSHKKAAFEICDRVLYVEKKR